MRIEKFERHSVFPVVLVQGDDIIELTTSDFQDLTALDKPVFSIPTMTPSGVVSYSQSATTIGDDLDPIPSGKKYSFGTYIDAAGIRLTEVTLSFSGTILTNSQSVQLSAHISGGFSDSPDGLDRSWSFGDYGSQSLLHHNTFYFDETLNYKNIFFWLTVSNYSSSDQPFRAGLSASFWTSALNYPLVRDVNAA